MHAALSVVGVAILTDTHTIQDFQLLPRGRLSGYVTDADNGFPLEATVTVEGMDPVSTDPATGYYEIYLDAGTYNVTAEAPDYASQSTSITLTWGEEVQRDFALLAAISVIPSPIEQTLLLGDVGFTQVTIQNNMASPYDFTLYEIPGGFTPTGSGGPDPFGYTYTDSNEPGGPAYQWVDISTTGTPVYLSDDDYDGPFPIGFAFNFYGIDWSDFYVSSNGFLSFGGGSSDLGNDCPLPNASTPNNLIALMWDDLDPGYTGDAVYYESFASCPYSGGTCLVAQYEGFHHYPGGGSMAGTFQTILFENGSILIQFEDAGTEEGSGSTTGIENGDGTIGLTYNCDSAASLSNGLAICYVYPGSPGCVSGADVPWLGTDIVSGTVPAGGTQGFATLFSARPAAGVYQPGQYDAGLLVSGDPSKRVPVIMTVLPPEDWGQLEGTITSLGYCDANPAPLEGAEVLIDNGTTFSLTTGADGAYSVWLEQGIYMVTVSADEHTGDSVVVLITAQATTIQDFDLRWLQPCASVEPAAISAALELGENTTLPLTIINTGAADLNFELQERPENVSHSETGHEISLSPSEDGGKTTLSGSAVGTVGPLSPEQYAWVVISPNPLAVSRPAGAVPDDGLFYLIGGESSGGSRFGRVQRYDPQNDTWDDTLATMPTPVSNLCAAAIGDDIYVPGGYDGISDIANLQVYHTDSDSWETITSDPLPAARSGPACATYDDRVYVFGGYTGSFQSNTWVYDPAASAGNRWTVLSDAPFTGAWGAALVIGDLIFYGGIYNGGDSNDAAAYDPTSDLWIVYPDLTTPRGAAGMWAIGDLLLIGGGGWSSYLTSVEAYDTSQGTSGSWTPFGASLVQGRRTFGWATAPFQGHLFVSGGWAGAYLSEAEVLDFEPVSGDVPWLSTDPITGTVPADGGLVVVDVTLDAAYVTQPDEYYATLSVDSDDPVNDRVDVPVTMTVNAPNTWGQLEGTVTSLGYCDVNPAPLEGAQVVIQPGTTVTLTTHADGAYSTWLEQGIYMVTVSADEHTDDSAWVLITAQATTTQDFDLRWLQPCMSVEPTALSAWLDPGLSTTLPLSISNSGAGDLDFELQERDRGFQPRLATGPVAGNGEWLYRAREGVMLPANSGSDMLAYPGAYRWEPTIPSQLNVLVYADDFVHTAPNTFVDQALQALGIPYTAHYDGDFSGFAADLTGGGPWDLVIFENDNYRSEGISFPEMLAYVQGGGELAAEAWTMLWDYADPLFTELGVSYVDNDLGAPPVYWWDPSHNIFNVPESAPPWLVRNCPAAYSCGQYLDPVPGLSSALAGYTAGPDVGQATLILRDDGRTVYKGFGDMTTDADVDGDTVLDGVELWMNTITGLLYGFGGDVPWLSTDPITGTVPADGGLVVIDVTLDSAYAMLGGDHYATLNIDSNDPVMGDLGVPVTMSVASLPPSVGSFEPNGGSGSVGQWARFTTTYTDPNSYEDIEWAYFSLFRVPSPMGGLAALYYQPADLLMLLDGGICQPGEWSFPSTGYVTLDCRHTTVSGAGEDLTINWVVRPEQCFAGGCGVTWAYEHVMDNAGLWDSGVLGWWVLYPASGQAQDAGPVARPTRLQLERLRKEIEAWRSGLDELR